MENRKVVVVPCSGIGKSLGTVGRVATYKVVDTWIKDHIKEDGLYITEFTLEMIFNMCSSDTKFAVLTSENDQGIRKYRHRKMNQ